MKIARFLSIPVVGLLVLAGNATADPSLTPEGSSDLSDSPYIKTDPDGVPLAVTQKPPQPLSQEQINAARKVQQQVEQNRNWLLRDYERQLQNRVGSQPNARANLYYQLSSNKELARLAGLPALDDDDDRSATGSYKSGISPAVTSSVGLRQDTAATSEGGFTPRSNLLSPLLSPFGSHNASGMHSLTSLPFAMPSPLAGAFVPQSAPVKSTTTDDLPSDLSMPGMVAAKSSTLMDPADLKDPANLSLDILPGESIEHAREHQDTNVELLQLPEPMSADQLHKNQTTTLAGPTNKMGPPTSKTLATPDVNAKPVDGPEAPTPISKTPQITPVRAPIANPYDILNR